MQLASGGDWLPPAANAMVHIQGTYTHVVYGCCSNFTRLCETWFSKNRWLFFASACRCICLVNPDHELCKVASLRRVDTQRLLNIQKTSFDKRLPGDPQGERVAWKFAIERFPFV